MEESQNREISDEEQTKSEIVVKPDGSRILMVTMSVGGMETTISIKISEPTSIQNDSNSPNSYTQQEQTIGYMISEAISDK